LQHGHGCEIPAVAGSRLAQAGCFIEVDDFAAVRKLS
jgi:hypothetical protein